MFCTQCGKQNPDSALFCCACGRAVLAVAEPVVSVSTSAPRAHLPVASGARANQRAVPSTIADATTRSRFAGFWTRVVAFVIDGLVMFAISVAGAIALGAAGLETSKAAVAGYYIMLAAAWWLYFAVWESSSKQATLGKRAVGIVVTDTSERSLSFGRASGRHFAKLLNSLTLGIGWIMVAFSRQKRGLHDVVAGTLVIRRKSKAGLGMIIGLCFVAMVPVAIIAAIVVPGALGSHMSKDAQARLAVAVQNDDRVLIEAALRAGADVNDSWGLNSPLGWAAEKGHVSAARILVANGADVNAHFGLPNRTALQQAAEAGQLEMVAYLVDAGADVNATNKFGRTALYHARYRSRLEDETRAETIVQFLLSKGAVE